MAVHERETDVLIIGGGLGGVAAALSVACLGWEALIVEPTDWLGGQLTTQAVPPDEHPWIEGCGRTTTYQRLRTNIRSYYHRNYPLLPECRFGRPLNPGESNVSPLAHEPRVALAAIDELLAPYRANRKIDVLLHQQPISVECDGDFVRAVTLQHVNGECLVVRARYVLDASEFGDLLELAKVEHVIGAESQAETGEPHALSGGADPFDQQAVTWCFAMDYLPNENHTIEKPEKYDFWRGYQADFWPGPQLGWLAADPSTLKLRKRNIFEGPTDASALDDLWHYRRIFYRRHFTEHIYPSDITLVNWPQNDYYLGPLIGVSKEERQQHLHGAKQLSLSLLYWMQTEAPRSDGGYGYPGLRLRYDVLDSDDGLAKHVYVRESRRIKAEFTVLEQHVGVEARQGREGAEPFADSVGIGSYRIDLHPSTARRTYVDISSWPFQIPLGALIPVRMENLLPACKNIGTTHITNGCYRLHPVEWNIGEVSGALAAYCITHGLLPRQVRNTPD